MKRVKLNRKLVIAAVIAVLLPAVVIVALFSAWAGLIMMVKYTSTWSGAVDFHTYKEEFELVRDYVEGYMNGDDGYLHVMYDREEKVYCMYDPSKKIYLDCPENVENALTTICTDAFTNCEVQLSTIRCSYDAVVFDTSVLYSLIYSPERQPIRAYQKGHSGIVVYKILGGGWYHVSTWTA